MFLKKYRKLLIMFTFILILLSSYSFNHFFNKPSKFDMMQELVKDGRVLEKDSQEQFLVDDIEVTFVKDHFNDVHIFYFFDESIISYYFYVTNYLESKVGWQLSTRKQRKIFTSVVIDQSIETIEVEGLNNEELVKVVYEGNLFYLSVTDFPANPVMIKGYSKENELIFSNILNEE